MKYTFTFDAAEECRFKSVMSRLSDDEYTIIEDIAPVDKDNEKTCDRTAVIEMDPEAALTFRLGMKNVKIRRERSEEELSKEKENEDRHKVKITVIMPPDAT